ncbi:class I SAM-dependent rRNA methyltransferase, partial [Akkermansiaceae bacterium]|nr:class I SAM-dependent rRNA methyltransferase [Akkermansiaceae bacterium]MDB4610816.1 class I SAM-dependent rRNA methyltransferase [Akkermansiaceae bacterium]
MAGIIIKPRSRIYHGHDWVYASEIQKTFGNPEPGDLISLKDFKDRPMGCAIYNPNSQIVARRISRRMQNLDEEFFTRRIGQAIAYRESLDLDINLCRMVWSESDGLPGLIVDRYGDHLVMQTTTVAMERRIDIITKSLLELLSPTSITLRNDSSMRKAEGLEEEIRMIHGTQPEPFTVTHGETIFEIDPANGQKTGLYLDIMDSYSRVAKLAKGKKVLDVFCNQGGFGLACMKAGAESVLAVDISESATEATKRNAELSGVVIETRTSNAFDFLRRDEDTFDLIILDPPSFTRNKKSVNDAMRGYKEIHLRALAKLNPSGILATFCCSHHATREIFLDSLQRAAVDGRRTLRMIDSHTQRLDHPV